MTASEVTLKSNNYEVKEIITSQFTWGQKQRLIEPMLAKDMITSHMLGTTERTGSQIKDQLSMGKRSGDHIALENNHEVKS